MVSSSYCISLVHKKCTSCFSRLRSRCVFLVRFGINVDIKFTVPRRLCSSCLSLGAASIAMFLTFFGHGFTPCGVMIRPKYSISCFLMQHLLGLNFSPAWYARSTVSNRWMSWRSSVDPCTLTSSAQGNVPGTPGRTWSISLQKISDDGESSKGKHTKQYFLKGVLNAVRSWLCSSSFLVQ